MNYDRLVIGILSFWTVYAPLSVIYVYETFGGIPTLLRALGFGVAVTGLYITGVMVWDTIRQHRERQAYNDLIQEKMKILDELNQEHHQDQPQPKRELLEELTIQQHELLQKSHAIEPTTTESEVKP